MRIKLLKDAGAAKKGDIFVDGLHEVPDYYKDGGDQKWDFWWKEGSQPEDRMFLKKSWISEINGDYKII